jgi:hypothetical protein
MVLLLAGERLEDCRGLLLGVGDREAQKPRLVFGVQAQARCCHNQTGRPLTLDQLWNEAIFVFFDSFVAQASFREQ